MWPSTARQRLEESCQRPSSGHRRPAASGRVEPTKASDSSPETCRSYLLVDRTWERVGKDRLWPGPGFPGGCRKLTLAGGTIASSVRFLAPPRNHTGGHFQPYDRSGRCHANDRFKSTAAIDRRPLEVAHSPEQFHPRCVLRQQQAQLHVDFESVSSRYRLNIAYMSKKFTHSCMTEAG